MSNGKKLILDDSQLDMVIGGTGGGIELTDNNGTMQAGTISGGSQASGSGGGIQLPDNTGTMQAGTISGGSQASGSGGGIQLP